MTISIDVRPRIAPHCQCLFEASTDEITFRLDIEHICTTLTQPLPYSNIHNSQTYTRRLNDAAA